MFGLARVRTSEVRISEGVLFIFSNHLIYEDIKETSMVYVPFTQLFFTKWLNKENNKNLIFNFNPNNFFFQISLLQYLEADFRKEKIFFNLFLKSNIDISIICST